MVVLCHPGRNPTNKDALAVGIELGLWLGGANEPYQLSQALVG